MAHSTPEGNGSSETASPDIDLVTASDNSGATREQNTPTHNGHLTEEINVTAISIHLDINENDTVQDAHANNTVDITIIKAEIPQNVLDDNEKAITITQNEPVNENSANIDDKEIKSADSVKNNDIYIDNIPLDEEIRQKNDDDIKSEEKAENANSDGHGDAVPNAENASVDEEHGDEVPNAENASVDEVDEEHGDEVPTTENASVDEDNEEHGDEVPAIEGIISKQNEDAAEDTNKEDIKSAIDEVSTAKTSEDSPAESVQSPLTTSASIELSDDQSEFIARIEREQKREKRITRYWILSVALLFLLLAAILTPLIVIVSYGVNAYATYNLLRAHAYGGINHLQTVKTIFTQPSTHPTSMFDETKLKKAEKELVAAQTDFVQVQSIIKNTPLIYTVTQYIPQYRPQVESAQAASQIIIDATVMGEQVLTVALKLAPRLQGPLLSSSNTPLLTVSDIALIAHTIDQLTPLFNNIQAQSRNVSLNALPISNSQRTQIEQVFQLLPQVQLLLQRGRELITPISWLFGIDQPRTFLVQTMDRAELRATGGFTGQYGELSINSGRVAPFSLHDISNIEYASNSPTTGHTTPAAYTSWWPFANWGLRDSNLSADFPTSARIAVAEYKSEASHSVDGVISFTPFFIEHILQAIGPLQIPRYNETVTAQNLEGLLHYYQLDNAGIRKIEIIEHISNGADVRKYFTSEVARVLMDRVRHASPTELMALGTQMLQDLKTKDLQVYFTNPQVEDLLEQYGYAASMDRSNTHDGLYIVQMNVSASKASQYVQTDLQDTVALDANGGATHSLLMHLIYNQIGPVYGLDTYRDYIRIYVPQSAHLLAGNGFDSGQPLCGGPYGTCSPYGIYPNQELVCPIGQYNAGASAPMIDDPYTHAWHPLDQIGPPNNTKSDEAGKAMFGGYVVIPKNCSMTVTVSWYVPPLSQGNYNLLFQRQSSTFPTLDLTVLPATKTCSSNGNQPHFNGIITNDTSFSLNRPARLSGACSLVENATPTG